MPSDISLQQQFIAAQVQRIREGLRGNLQEILEMAERGLEDLAKARMPPRLPEIQIADAMRRLGELHAYKVAGEVLESLAEAEGEKYVFLSPVQNPSYTKTNPAPKAKKVRR